MVEAKYEKDGEFTQKIGSREERKMKARRNRAKGVWFGLGMMGMIGWSVAIPALIGVAIGVWLDIRYPGHIFLEAYIFIHRTGCRLCQCLVLG